MVYKQTRSVLKKETLKLLWEFGILTDQQIQARRPDPVAVEQKKKRTFQLANFDLLVDHKLKIKEKN